MPSKPPRPCRHVGCPERVTSTHGYCPAHAHEASDRHRRYDGTRPNAHQRGYTRVWNNIRAEVLAAQPHCAACGARAVVVDHIVPLRFGGTHDLSNLQPLCRSCHSRKTHAERKEGTP